MADPWYPLFDLGVKAYYRGELDLGRAACEHLLSLSGLPDFARLQARRNQSFYAQPLSELVPSAAYTPCAFPVPKHWTRFNPSIAACDGGYRMIVRSSNYAIGSNGPWTLDGGDVIRAQNYLLSLDADLACRQIESIDDQAARSRALPSRVVGFDDCRLFHHDGSWFALATTREHHPSWLCRMALMRLEDGRFGEPQLLCHGDGERHEKNWTPLVLGDELLFIYSFRPTVILRYRLSDGGTEQIAGDPGPPIATDSRGGSQALALEQGFLCLIHESIWFDDGGLVYLHRFVLLDRSFKLTHVSRQFFFLERSVEFCAGLARRGSLLVASFGLRDQEAFVASMRLEEVLAALRPVAASDEREPPPGERSDGPPDRTGGIAIARMRQVLRRRRR